MRMVVRNGAAWLLLILSTVVAFSGLARAIDKEKEEDEGEVEESTIIRTDVVVLVANARVNRARSARAKRSSPPSFLLLFLLLLLPPPAAAAAAAGGALAIPPLSCLLRPILGSE